MLDLVFLNVAKYHHIKMLLPDHVSRTRMCSPIPPPGQVAVGHLLLIRSGGWGTLPTPPPPHLGMTRRDRRARTGQRLLKLVPSSVINYIMITLKRESVMENILPILS